MLQAEGATRTESNDMALGLVLVGVVAVMMLPLPPLLLDVLLSTNMALSLLVFLVALHLDRPLEFSSFPSLLLVITLFRLALNVATTRLILQHGADGPGAVGTVIHAFGQVVVGGSYVIGAVVFVILIIINFIVITKGAGRVAEVAARFTLDSMPGKQMAIDADLGAGLITEREARLRRRMVEQEADFYGAMDGASKFVRGDAVAGLLVTGINIIGGLIVGVLQKGLDIAEAARTFTVLTIGDGLVSQVPALLISAAAGVVTTRAAAGSSLGGALSEQLFGRRRSLLLAGGILLVLGLVPGMPWVFLLLGGGLAYLARRAMPEVVAQQSVDPAGGQSAQQPRREQPEDLLPIDLLALEVGYELVPLVDAERDGSMLRRIATLRRQFAQEYGIVVPPIHVRDNLRLKPGEYRLLLLGNELGRGTLRVRCMLAMTKDGNPTDIPGEETREPAFGLPARWIAVEDAERAAAQGMTVVDPATVMATHLGEMIRAGAPELLGRREVEHLLENFAKTQPKIVEELVPAMMPLGDVAKVLRNLLREGLSIRDLRTILEGLADHAAQVKDPDVLTELVRQRMARHITSRYRAEDGAVYGIILDAKVEELFRPQPGRQGLAVPEPRILPRILAAVEATVRDLSNSPHLPLLITAPDVRRAVAAVVMRHVPGLQVISYREIEPSTPIRTLGVVTLRD
ncbi:MAG: flagellar biosynthesis protein FlhA [Myxococcales bacterium]|nr:flagellar biosynthesis protein FlhA [Myxococcota bacterium]MDW8283355.1 flagellar biosynthesis protein FlhA [Myxococcales bacterium]